MMNSGEREVRQQERRSAWCGVQGGQEGVLTVREKHGMKLSGANPGRGALMVIEKRLSSAVADPC